MGTASCKCLYESHSTDIVSVARSIPTISPTVIALLCLQDMARNAVTDQLWLKALMLSNALNFLKMIAFFLPMFSTSPHPP